MGISTNYYTMYGFRVGEYSDEFSEAYEDYDYNVPNLDVIADGMSGDYVFFGKVFFKSGDYRWNEVDGVEVGIDPADLVGLKEEISKTFVDQFPTLSHYLDDAKWKIYSFLHFS